MSIVLNRSRTRNRIAWLDSDPPGDAARLFTGREYLVSRCSIEDLRDTSFLTGLVAVVATADSGSPARLSTEIVETIPSLLDHGCMLVLRGDDAALSMLAAPDALKKLPMSGIIQNQSGANGKDIARASDLPAPFISGFNISVPWSEIANTISSIESGPGANLSLKIEGLPESSLSESDRILLRRAFWNCSRVHLFSLDEGKSSARVYRACSELVGGADGQWPQSHFVKIGPRAPILNEYENYVLHVEPYVPFHLGPHLVKDRCFLGAMDGIIVGDYVEESESLSECAADGRSLSAVACLFDRTLLGWHRQWRREQTPLWKGLVARFPRKINQTRLAQAQQLGAMKTLDQLRALFMGCDFHEVLVGPVHGDLHSKNVRVRATDAIVIDFLQRREFPLVFDAASLEASLVIDGFARLDDSASTGPPQEWLDSLMPLYDVPPFVDVAKHVSPKDPNYWFYANVHQIRRHARQWDRGTHQYAAALALALLIKATKDYDAKEAESYRRAGAYVLAEKLLIAAFENSIGGQSTQPAAHATTALQ